MTGEDFGTPPLGLYVGQLFGDRFKLRRLYNVQNGVQRWFVRDQLLNKDAVLHWIPCYKSSTILHAERLANCLRDLRSPNLPEILCFGADVEGAALVTEFAPGAELGELLRQRHLTVVEFLGLARDVVTGLQRMHELGILHRDLKPDNIIIRGSGHELRATLVEFGLSQFEQHGASLEKTVVETLRYMSPEQSRIIDREVGAASDLYSLGTVFYECLGGQPLFDGDGVGEVLRQHLSSSPRLLSTMGLGVPRSVDDFLQNFLHKEPSERYASTQAVLRDLEELERAIKAGHRSPRLAFHVGGGSSIADPEFIGRETELKLLTSELERAHRGDGRIVLVEAESGGGKSRLVEEFTKLRPAVFWGQGRDHTAQQPFEIFAGLARELLRKASDDPAFRDYLQTKLHDHLESICDIFPDFTKVFGAVAPQVNPPEALGEIRSLRALSALIDELGTDAEPAVIVLDDCQWADDLSLKLLSFWQRDPELREPQTPRYVMMIVAYRSEEVPSDHRLRSLKHCASLALKPFSRGDLISVIESMTGPLSNEVYETIAELSRGNPFMVSAIVHGLVEIQALKRSDGRWICDGEKLAEAQASRRAASFLAKRLSRFPAETLHLLSTGAILGKEFDLRVLALLAKKSEENCHRDLELACNRKVIWANLSRTAYTFVHDQIRETLLALLPPAERLRRHLEAAIAIEALDRSRIFDLAYHYSEGGDLAKALPYALAAAEEARSRYSLQISARYFKIAKLGADAVGSECRLAAYEGLGDVLMLLGRYDEAAIHLTAAREFQADPRVRARVQGKVGELYFKTGDVQKAADAVEEALRLLGRGVPRSALRYGVLLLWELGVQTLHSLFPRAFLARRQKASFEDAAQVIRMYSRLAYIYWFGRGRLACGWAHLREMNLAERYPVSLELAQAYSEHAPVTTMIPWFKRGIAYAQRSFEIRKSFGDIWGQGQSLHFYGIILYASSRYEESIEKCTEAVRLLERTGDRWEVNTARWHIAYGHYRLGQLRKAYEISRSVYQAGLEIGDHQAVGISLAAWAKATEGRIPAEAVEQQLRRAVGDVHTRVELLQAEALRFLHLKRPAAAVESLERARDLLRASKLRQEYVAPVLPWLATALREQLEATPAQATQKRAGILNKARKVVAEAHYLAESYTNNLPHALREKAYFEALDGNERDAQLFFVESFNEATRQGARFEEALTLYHRGKIGRILNWVRADQDFEEGHRKLELIRGPMLEVVDPERGRHSKDVSFSLLDRFDTLLDVGHSIASAISRPLVFEAVNKAAVSLLRGEHCDIHVLEGAPENYPKLLRLSLERKRPVLSSEFLAAHPGSPFEVDILSGICTPIFVHGEVAACFSVSHRRISDLFGKEELRLAEFIATLAGAALENSEGFSKIQALSEERGRLHSEAQEALRTRDVFLSVASHELRTPLNSIYLQSQLLMRTAQRFGYSALSKEMIDKLLMTTHKQIDRLNRLLDDLLEVSKTSLGKLNLNFEDTDLGLLVREILERYASDLESSGCTCHFVEEQKIVGSVDRMRTEQIINNLISNAMKYAPRKPIEICLRSEGDRAFLSVRDHGPGIPPESQKRVFQRFERGVSEKKISGFGLGLYIANELAKAHQGSLSLESSLGHGSTFTLSLPIRAPEKKTNPSLESVATGQAAEKSIEP